MSNLVLNAGWLGDWFYGIWINLMLLIDNVIYVFINWMYRVFMLVAKVDIFGGGAEIEAITRRVYVIVGIAMLFIFAYNLILLIINPEGKQLGNMGKVVQRSIVSIILVTLLPLIFSYLTTIQNHVLESNVIGQIILGTSSEEDIQTTNKKAGVKAALDIFSAFYHPKGQTYNSCKSNSGAHELCSVYVEAFDAAYQNDDISTFVWDDDLKDGAKEDKMEYNWIISTAAGVFALWMFVSFALDIGVRVGKMAFYELISPIPVMMRILPNDKMYDKWFKGITSTFISLFIRLAVIYFCMYAITLVPNILTNMWASNGDNIVLLALANVVVILGILKFAQEAPKLISDLFGSSGDGLKFGIAGKVKDNKLAMGAMGMTAGGALGFAGNVRKMFSKDEATGDTKFKWTNPLRGVGKGMYTGATKGYKADSFQGLGYAIDDAATATAAKRAAYEAKRDRRQQKGEDILEGTFAEDSKVAQKVVGTFADMKDAVSKGVKEGIENVDNWLLGGSGSKTVREAITNASSKLDAMTKKYTGDNVEVAKKVAEDWRKKYLRGEEISIPGAGTFKKGVSADKDFAEALKTYQKEVKRADYESKFGEVKVGDATFKAYQRSVVEALQKTLPALGESFSATMCQKYKKEFKLTGNVSISSIMEEIKTSDPGSVDRYGEKLEFVSKQLKDRESYLGLLDRQAKESKK